MLCVRFHPISFIGSPYTHLSGQSDHLAASFLGSSYRKTLRRALLYKYNFICDVVYAFPFDVSSMITHSRNAIASERHAMICYDTPMIHYM